MEITIEKLTEGINAKAHRKDDKLYKGYKIVSFDGCKFSEPLDIRFYATESTTYCCVWGSINGEYFNGSGKATGYGYDRSSAAFWTALKTAGINISNLSGTGQNEDAIHLIAGAMGLETYKIVSFFG